MAIRAFCDRCGEEIAGVTCLSIRYDSDSRPMGFLSSHDIAGPRVDCCQRCKDEFMGWLKTVVRAMRSERP